MNFVDFTCTHMFGSFKSLFFFSCMKGTPKSAHETQRERVASHHDLARAAVRFPHRRGPGVKRRDLPPCAAGTLRTSKSEPRRHRWRWQRWRRLTSGTHFVMFTFYGLVSTRHHQHWHMYHNISRCLQTRSSNVLSGLGYFR